MVNRFCRFAGGLLQWLAAIAAHLNFVFFHQLADLAMESPTLNSGMRDNSCCE